MNGNGASVRGGILKPALKNGGSASSASAKAAATNEEKQELLTMERGVAMADEARVKVVTVVTSDKDGKATNGSTVARTDITDL